MRFQFLRDDIARIALVSYDVPQLKRRLAEWADSLRGDERIANTIMQPAVMADLAGQLFVQNVELGQKKRLLADDRRPAFLRLPYAEALDYWTAQGGSREMLDKILAGYRKNAQAATELMLDNLSRTVIGRVESALANGDTLQDFAAGVRNDTVALGISPASSSYLETVYRTNVQTAYGAGRFRQLTNPDVMEVRRWAQYRTAGDNRVRENHALLDGVIFRIDSSEWHRIAPPCGFRCRCSICSLDDEGVRQELQRGGRLASDIDPDDLRSLLQLGPDDDSFAGPPTQTIEA
ncbi:MAG: minor capsid protein [Sandaracinaceae bacterium]|nr:minor capsid protein [Sandaracinaceae bacterium]